MRVIAGSLGGRIFASPHGHRTHPMSDKARGGLFNTLGDIEGLTVLDAFAGSGALGFEAISRGVASVLAIENDKLAQRTITENIAALGVGAQMKLIKAGAGQWLHTNPGVMFDLVLLDPPYDNLQPNLLYALAQRTGPGGIVVVSHPPNAKYDMPDGFTKVAERPYGDAQLSFWRQS